MRILDFSYNPVGFCTGFINLIRTSKLEKGDKEITFSVPNELLLINDTLVAEDYNITGDLVVNSANPKVIEVLREQFFVEYDNDRYCVKEIKKDKEFNHYTCMLDIEDLRGTVLEDIKSNNNTISDTLELINYSSSGWLLECDSKFTKRRSISMQRFSLWALVSEIIKVYTCEIQIDSINRVVYFTEHVGFDNDVYFVEGLNLQGVNVTTDTFELFTKCIPLGAGDLDIGSVNNNINYIENYQFTDRTTTFYWKDERYTDALQLKEDAEIRLDALSKPRINLEITLKNLAAITNNYAFLKVNVGDTVTLLIDGKRIKHRVFQLVEYKDDPSSDSITLDNTTPNLDSYLQESANNFEQSLSRIRVEYNSINLEIADKINKDEIVAAINLTSEEAKIKANKITLEGTVTTGDQGRRVKILNSDYTVLEGDEEKAFIGLRKFENNYLVPKIYLGADGFNVNEDSYFGITSYRGGGDNPQSILSSYVDLSFRSNDFKDWSNIKMYDDGVMRIAPIKELQITSNFINDEYAGAGENNLALFTTTKHDLFNSNLQIGCINNTNNGYGLILLDSHKGNDTGVRIHEDDLGGKYLRPLKHNDVELGSLNYAWSKLSVVAAMSNQNVTYSQTTPMRYTLENNSVMDVLDNINFLPPVEPQSLARAMSLNNEETNNNPVMDVTGILNTDYVELSDTGEAFINESELLKLALMEIKQLKERVKILESGA